MQDIFVTSSDTCDGNYVIIAHTTLEDALEFAKYEFQRITNTVAPEAEMVDLNVWTISDDETWVTVTQVKLVAMDK